MTFARQLKDFLKKKRIPIQNVKSVQIVCTVVRTILTYDVQKAYVKRLLFTSELAELA